MKTFMTAVLLTLALVAATSVAAQEEPTTPPAMEQLWQVGGEPAALDVQDSYAYLGVGDRLQVFDLSDPGKPKMIGQSEPLAWTLDYIDVEDNYAYILDGRQFAVFDISNPTKPKMVGELSDELYGYKIVVQGTYAYVAAGYDGIAVVDISDPASPKLAYNGHGNTFSLAISSRHLFRSGGYNLVAYDVSSDPKAPREVKTFGGEPYTGSYRHIAAGGDILASISVTSSIKGEAETLRVFNVSDIQTPTMTFEEFLGYDRVSSLEVINNELFVATYGEIFRYNLNDLSQPPTQKVRQGASSLIRKAGNEYVVLDEVNGFFVLNGDLSLVGDGYTVPVGFAAGVSCRTETNSLAVTGNGLWTVDPRTQEARHTRVNDTSWALNLVTQNSTRVFATDWDSRLWIFEDGEVVDELEIDEPWWSINSLEATEDILVVGAEQRIRLFNAKTLRLWSWIKRWTSEIRLSPDGRFLFVSGGGSYTAITIYDLADVRNPKEIGQIEPFYNGVAGFELLPDHRIVVVEEYYTSVYDFTDLAKPKLINRWSHGEWLPGDSDVRASVEVVGDTAYIGVWYKVIGLNLVTGERTSLTKLKADIGGLCLSGDTLVVAAGEQGLIGLATGGPRHNLFLPLVQR